MGIDSIGTKALEMNVSGKMITNPMPITASGERTRMPSHRPIQIIAEANSSSSASASITCENGGVGAPADDEAGAEQDDDGQDRSEHLGQVVAEEVGRSSRRAGIGSGR